MNQLHCEARLSLGEGVSMTVNTVGTQLQVTVETAAIAQATADLILIMPETAEPRLGDAMAGPDEGQAISDAHVMNQS